MRKPYLTAAALLLATNVHAACDRACLEGVVNQYLDAMVAHDSSKAPFARNVKHTENAVKLPLTEGL